MMTLNKKSISHFFRSEDGAVTVDWVVLTATLIFLGIATAFYVATSVPHVANMLSSHMSNKTVIPN